MTNENRSAGNWFIFDSEGGEEETGVEISRVSPLLGTQTAINSSSSAPVVPTVEFKNPDGTANVKPVPGDPEYKAAMENFRRSLALEIANAYIQRGVKPESQSALSGVNDEDLVKLSSAIRGISFVTESAISAVGRYGDPLVREGLIAASFFRMDVYQFLESPVVIQATLIDAFRAATAARQR